jgi:hypothetical protein
MGMQEVSDDDFFGYDDVVLGSTVYLLCLRLLAILGFLRVFIG